MNDECQSVHPVLGERCVRRTFHTDEHKTYTDPGALIPHYWPVICAEHARRDCPVCERVHWLNDSNTTLHANGRASFKHTTRNEGDVTCKLCLTLLARDDSE